MILLKTMPVLLLVIIVGADKKIELQDIEEDNLKSEKGIDYEIVESRSEDANDHGSESIPLEYLKSGIFRYFKSPSPTQASQQQRYVQQYAVTEPQERSSVTAKPIYGPPPAQQTTVGHLSNIPMQFYLVPPFYENSDHPSNSHTEAHYSGQPGEPEQTETNYIQVSPHGAPTPKTFIQPYSSSVTYVTYSAQPTVAPTPTSIAPVLTYQVPVLQYQTDVVAPSTHQQNFQQQSTNVYYPSQQNTPTQVENDQDNDIESQKYFSSQTEVPYIKSQIQDMPRYYNSRTPLREEYRNSPSELPHPSPLLLKAPHPHLAHIPKALPVHRPLSKPVYNNGGFGVSSFIPRLNEPYGAHFKRRPTSLLDSYVPSSLQIEYLKRGIIKDPLVAYEALSNSRHFAHPLPSPRHYERGFLPNQMFHTTGGGTIYGHYKRSPKVDRGSKIIHN